MVNLVPLNLLGSGQTARIQEVVGDAEHVHRLREMGLHGGKPVEMVRGGSPCIIRLDGSNICFRADEVTTVLVQRDAS